MVRIHKGWIAYGFAAALMTAGPFAFAHDQSQQEQSDQSDPAQQGQTQKGSMQGQTQGQSVQRNPQAAQQKMDQEKQALRDKVKKELDGAQSQIDTLQGQLASKTGAERTRDEQLLKQAIAQRDALNVDLTAIDSAQAKDWNSVKTTANNDLTRFRGVIRRVAAVQKKPAPRGGTPRHQGSTQQQPQGGSQQGGSGGSSDTNK